MGKYEPKVLIRRKTNGADNQQETKFPFEMGWLVGFIEGDGTFSITPSGRYKGKHQYKPVIRIYNTDYKLIEKTIECCEKLGVAFYIKEERPRTPKIGKYSYRPIYCLVISGYKRIKKFFDVVSPEYFSGKGERAKLVYDFVKSRLEREKGWQFKKWGYNEYELSIVHKIKELNLRSKGKRILNDHTSSVTN